MILEFFNIKEIEEEKAKIEITNGNFRNQREIEYFPDIKRNIIDSFLFNNNLLSESQILPKSNSEPNLKRHKNNHRTKKIINEDKHNNLKKHEKENKINDKPNIKNIKNNIEYNVYFNEIDNNGNNQQNEIIFHNKDNLDIIINKKDFNLKNKNSNNKIYKEDNNNIFQNKDEIKSKNINDLINKHKNLLEENSSQNISNKKNSINNSLNNSTSFCSSSSFGRNFILKNKVCKSTKNFGTKFYYKNKNNNRDDNPIMTYYLGKDLPNFYLFEDKGIQEESDGFQYMNFFPTNGKEIKNKNKDIMSCIYIDKKGQKIRNNESKNKGNEADDDMFNFNKDDNMESKEKYENLNLNTNSDNNIINDMNKIKHFGNDINNKDNINNNIFDEKIDIYKNKNNNKNFNISYNNIQIENNNDLNMNNNISQEDNQTLMNKYDSFSLDNNKELNKNNSGLRMDHINENNNFMNNINDNILKNINFNNYNNINFPLSFSNTNFNLNDTTNLKEIKLTEDILNEISNLNKKLDLNSNYFTPNKYKNQSSDNFYNPINKQYNNIANNNEFNLNNININDLNLTDNLNFKFNKKIFTITNDNEKLNVINMLPYNKSFYQYTDDEILKYAIPLIKDQSGCRFLQEKIKTNQYFANENLFPKIKNNIKELSCDQFGNYFLQVLLDVLTNDKVNLILDLLQKDFTSLCICSHGTRVIQKIIEKISNEPNLMIKLISLLNTKDLGNICKSAYGNHLMQKYLSIIHNPEYTKFIYDYTFNNFMEIAETKHGVCVIQKCVCEGDEIQRKKIYDLILENFDIIIKDQFANYLIQYILVNTKTKEKYLEIMPLIKKLEENILDYCILKFPANVIEKCFENNDNYIREHILEYLLKNHKDKIIEILLDEYGIYIIQKAINLNSFYKKELCDIITQNENELKNINLNEFKYRGVLKIINSNKELQMLLYNIKGNNPNTPNYNNKNKYNNYYYNNKEGEYRNNRGKKRGRKNNRGRNDKY